MDFNPRSPWGERLRILFRFRECVQISIHAPRGGSDLFPGFIFGILVISIHAPRGGSDRNSNAWTAFRAYFNPRSPWGERPRRQQNGFLFNNFNPRSPWGERLQILANNLCISLFQSTLPVGGATTYRHRHISARTISIHAPRGGSDSSAKSLRVCLIYFNPRSPWGERPEGAVIYVISFTFQSTLPVGGATYIDTDKEISSYNFNPRSPWGERHANFGAKKNKKRFQSTLPVGGATPSLPTCLIVARFQSTLPVGGATCRYGTPIPGRRISIHAPRGGSDGAEDEPESELFYFNPRSPWGERQQRCTVLGAHLWRRYIIFAHFREIGLSAWAASGESGGKQRSKSRANLPGIFCLPGLRNQRIRGASGI